MELLQNKTTDIRRKIRRRLSQEISTYLIVLGISLVFSFGHFGLPPVIYLIYLLIASGVLIGALSYKSRQLRSINLPGTLREALTYLIEKVDSTMKVYMATYMLMITGSIVILEIFVLIKHSEKTLSVALAVAGGLAGIAICYWCGKHYLERILGKHKTRLVACLNELNAL